MYGPMPAGGSVQLQAKIQNLFIEAMQFAERKVPAGYVLVPVEPTPEMCDVGHIGIDVLTGVTSDSEYYSTWGDSAAKLYRAMLSAAPKVTP